MKKAVLFIFCLFCVGETQAQDFEKGGNYISIGFGFDPYYKPLGKYGIGPIILNYERGITDVLGIGRIGVGGGFSTTFFPGNYYNGKKYAGTRFSITARAAYHFEFDVPKMDVYAGVGGAVNINNTPYYNNGLNYGLRSSVSGIHYIFAGIRYYFTDAFGVYAEAGHGHRALSGGIVFAF